MTETAKALYAFWASFGIPAYLQGQVPAKAQLPYITYTTVSGARFAQSVLSAFVWCASLQQCTSFLDRIAQAIPEGGHIAPLSQGKLYFSRNNDFQTIIDDADDPSVIGGRTSYIVEHWR